MKRMLVLLALCVITITASSAQLDNKSYPGHKIKVKLGDGLSMKFVEIYPGKFVMGASLDSSYEDPVYNDINNERPTRVVQITKGFYISQYEVTQAQYQKVMGNNPSLYKPGFRGIPGYPQPAGYKDTSNLPVEEVNWYDAVNFCNALSIQQGLTPCYTTHGGRTKIKYPDKVKCSWTAKGFRLPTEAEWEYCCRAGTTTKYWWGNDDKENVVGGGNKAIKAHTWYCRNADRDQWSYKHVEKSGPQPVGTKPANPWGLFDMNGNVSEWCWDYARSGYSEVVNTHIDPRGPTHGHARITRGGSWAGNAFCARSAFRYEEEVTEKSCCNGIRVILVK